MVLVVIFAAVQLGAFFLPWIHAGTSSMSGYAIPSGMRGLASFAERSARAPILTKTQILSLNLLYVLPLLAIIAGVIHMARAGNAAKTVLCQAKRRKGREKIMGAFLRIG